MTGNNGIIRWGMKIHFIFKTTLTYLLRRKPVFKNFIS